FGHPQPAFGRRELPKESMACFGQREDVAALAALRRSAGKIRATLERIAGCPKQQRRGARLQKTTANTELPQAAKAQRDEKEEDRPAHQRRILRRIRNAP